MKSKNELAKSFQLITGQKFEDFYHKYRPKLVWYLTKYTKDQEKAEDFADDAFTQALLKIDNYDKEKSQIHTWVYKIGENLVKKDFKDRKRMTVFSLDKDNNDNLNLINIIPNSDINDRHKFEMDHILVKKAEIVKDAIFQLPEKYKRVMVMREIENKSYLQISELCTKEYPISLEKDNIEMPDPIDFLDLKIENNGNDYCYIDIEYNKNKKLQLKIKPKEIFILNKNDIDKINNEKHLQNSDKNITKVDVYFILCMFNDNGMTFNDMTKILLDNNLNKYLINYSANIRRCSLPEYSSYPSDVKKFMYDEVSGFYTPLKDYLDNNKENIINHINILLNDNLSNDLSDKLINILKKINNSLYSKDDELNEEDENIFKSIKIDTSSSINGLYRTKTNLSTIKSQISKGRQLIQTMVKKKFKELDDNGLE